MSVILLGDRHRAVPHQLLDGLHVDAVLSQLGAERMPRGVQRHAMQAALRHQIVE